VQVFISWSKQVSHGLARALYEWLPDVIHRVEPWMSSEDIRIGQRWSPEVWNRLDDTSQGIICVTKDNMEEPWLNFEAGALAKSLQGSVVRPVLLGVNPLDIIGPLDHFQAAVATDEQDMLKLVKSLNDACEVRLDDTRLERAFTRTWNEYLDKVQHVVNRSATPEVTPQRALDDLLGEVLERVRDMQRSLAPTVTPLVTRPSRDPGSAPRRRRSLPNMVMAELRQIANRLEIQDYQGMRKPELIEAIRSRRMQQSSTGSSDT
jgi:hypothetical protein